MVYTLHIPRLFIHSPPSVTEHTFIKSNVWPTILQCVLTLKGNFVAIIRVFSVAVPTHLSCLSSLAGSSWPTYYLQTKRGLPSSWDAIVLVSTRLCSHTDPRWTCQLLLTHTPSCLLLCKPHFLTEPLLVLLLLLWAPPGAALHFCFITFQCVANLLHMHL